MDEKRLAEIEARIAAVQAKTVPVRWDAPNRAYAVFFVNAYTDLTDLLAEVRTLRSLLLPFVNMDNWDSGEYIGRDDPVRKAGEHLRVWPWVDDEDDA